MSGGNRWLRLEVYSLFAATGVAVGICAFQLIRNISGNPEISHRWIFGRNRCLVLVAYLPAVVLLGIRIT
ncbi:unnamed protein product [Linum trigynum]|uniref:Uncharacterized protein n=1 Tax=Linum trigynum TaxID=586398 RepID=A0AAV2DF39_9ROSI